MARLFDAYIMVDWSAAAKPTTGANSIWIGILARDARLKFHFRAVNPPTRLNAQAIIRELTERLTNRGDRVLLGFDFPLGYPSGTAAALGLDVSGTAPWQAMYAHLSSKMKDKPDNNSKARFAVAASMNYSISRGPFPFWGAPKNDQANTLQSTKPPFGADKPLREYRLVEQQMRDAGQGQPKSVWQIYGNGSVGSQSLTGIPHVHALRQAWPEARIWPFELGDGGPLSEEDLAGVKVVIAEIYPSLVRTKPESGEVADAAQIRGIAHRYAELDEKRALSDAFSTAKGLEPAQNTKIQAEEGWILGI